MYPGNNPGSKGLTRLPNDNDRASLYGALQKYGKFTELCWLMSPEPKIQETLPLPIINDVLLSPEFLAIDTYIGQISYLKSKMKMDKHSISQIALFATGQRENPTWQILRKGRLTSSRFGQVLQAKRVTPSLMKRLLNQYNQSSVKSVMWGVTNEATTVKEFQESSKFQVNQTGLWLDESGILGTSPDGLNGDDCVLECKCPFTQRDKSLEDRQIILFSQKSKWNLLKEGSYLLASS